MEVHVDGDFDSLRAAELSAQCTLATWVYAHLRHYRNVVGAEPRSTELLGYAPVDVFEHFTVFLSTLASISKMLYPVRKEFSDRGRRLRELLQLDALEHLPSRAVRNAPQSERCKECRDRAGGRPMRLHFARGPLLFRSA